MALKGAAWWLTGAVGLLSDAMESGVNLAAAVMTLLMLTVAAKPPDEEHAFGHDKAEYFASGVEGALILFAAAAIVWSALPRLIEPQPIKAPWVGIAVSMVASALNLVVALLLLRASRQYGSIALRADAHHLLTDVWTSLGVVAGVIGVAATGWTRLDPIVAILVAANIVWAGVGILRQTVQGLLDTAIPAEEQQAVSRALQGFAPPVAFSGLRTRQSGRRRFISLNVHVPGDWTVDRGHALLDEVEEAVRVALPEESVVFTHLEPLARAGELLQADRSSRP